MAAPQFHLWEGVEEAAEPSYRLFQPFCGLFLVQLCSGCIIAVLKNNREQEKDLVATGILDGAGTLTAPSKGRTAVRPYSLSQHSASVA
jgi:hypothetical protein